MVPRKRTSRTGRTPSMQRLITWLADKLLPEREAPELPLWQTSARSVPKMTPQKSAGIAPTEFTSEVGGRIEDGGPGKNVLVRNRYIREDTGTHETLKIISATAEDQEEEDGQDPYNTGRFDRSKSWGSNRSRK